jgi:hypothetical protein
VPCRAFSQGATHRPPSGSTHFNLEADPAPFGSNHAPPHVDARVQVRVKAAALEDLAGSWLREAELA